MTRQPAAATQIIPVSERRFKHLHVDFVGLLPTSAEGFKYLFTIIDQSTRWVEAIPVKNMEGAMIADALVAGRDSRFGAPVVITSDRGTQFTSAVCTSSTSPPQLFTHATMGWLRGATAS
jgi:hypothetical protein